MSFGSTRTSGATSLDILVMNATWTVNVLLWTSFDHGYDLEREHFSADIRVVSIYGSEWVDEMSCRKGVWKFDTLCETTLWVRVKRHAIHHWLYSLCTEDMWKVTARSHGRLVENTLLIAERILDVTILCHNILLVFGLVISDIRMMSLISVDQWLWYIDQFYILFWIRLESGTAYCLSWKYLHWFGIGIVYYVFDVGKVILSKWWEHSYKLLEKSLS